MGWVGLSKGTRRIRWPHLHTTDKEIKMTPILLICAVPILAACLAWREHLRANQPQARATSVNSATPAEDARYNRTVCSGARPAGDDFAGSGVESRHVGREVLPDSKTCGDYPVNPYGESSRSSARPARDSILIRRQILLQL